jgi:hypothetical protein
MLFNFFIGGIIGLIYYLIVCQISNNLFLENKTPLSMQKSILFLYFGGLIGLYLGSCAFSNKNKMSNSSLKIGLYFGSSILLFNAIIVNWDAMDNQTKLLILGINFGLLIWYSFYKIKQNKIENEINRKKELLQKKELEKKKLIEKKREKLRKLLKKNKEDKENTDSSLQETSE